MGYKPEQELDSMSQWDLSQFCRDHLPLGTHPTFGHGFYVTEESRYAAMSVLGLSGTGKSGLLEMIFHLSAISGQCTIFVAPDDNSINKCIARLPEDLLHKTYLLNMEDIEFPFVLNILGNVNPADEIKFTEAVNRVMHVFETQWSDIMSQAHFPRYLRMATIALLCNKDCTLPDMLRFLTDGSFRQEKLKAVKDQSVLDFWQRFDEMSRSARNQQVEPLIVRLENLFAGRSMMRNLLGHTQSSVNFRKVIEDGDILLVSLPIKRLKQEAKLIGAVFIALLHSSLFSFIDLLEEKRPGFSLIIDEWQNFCSSDIAELINEGRKFKVKLCLCNQYLSQLPSSPQNDLQAAMMATHTKVFFRQAIEDAGKVAHLFPNIETTVKPEDMEHRVIEHLLTNGSDNPDVTTFVETYLRPVRRASKTSGKMEVKHPGFRPQALLNAFLHVPAPANPMVSDPLPDLNDLLYKAMKSGEPPARIPSGMCFGFANCGRGFYEALNWGRKDKLLVLGNIQFTPDMVEHLPNGDVRWIKRVRSGSDQLYHFLYHLIMTIEELTYKPIGKRSKSTVTDVAQELMSLQFRHAYVKSGDESGVIRTDDTFEPVSNEELDKRLTIIQEQTRLKYCKPKAEVEKGTTTGTQAETKINHSEVI